MKVRHPIMVKKLRFLASKGRKVDSYQIIKESEGFWQIQLFRRHLMIDSLYLELDERGLRLLEEDLIQTFQK
jgi:hypothetical protein